MLYSFLRRTASTSSWSTLLSCSCRTSRSLATGLLRVQPIPTTGTSTKIVCTLGPSSDTAEQVQKLFQNGLDVARLNFSHAGDDYSYPEANLKLVRETPGRHADLMSGSKQINEAEQSLLPKNVRAVLVDTKGPEIRTGPLPGNADVVEIPVGATVRVTINDVVKPPPADGGESATKDMIHLNVDYQSIAKTVPVGGEILLDDGLIALQVEQVDTINYEYVICKALNGGPIKKNKGVNLPGQELDLPALTDKDKRDLLWACRHGADFVAASFIRNASNVRHVIAYLDRCIADLNDNDVSCRGKDMRRPLVISKIESKEGVE